MKKLADLIVIVVLLTMFSCAGNQSKNRLLDPTVQIESGIIKGVVNDDDTVVVFKGVPYAAPPVADLRWKEPQPPVPWEGVRDASDFCANCMQNRAFSRNPWTEEFMVQDSISEDRLFLNIWTPAKNADDKLAVLVYIHGGGYVEGSGSVAVYDGEELSKKGIIVITINYRLGALSFLAHPELIAESPHHASGNYGFLYQVAALRWIKANITAFGGDPSRVTIAGQSATAGSVNALIISPLAAGLFNGAITESGTSYSSGIMVADIMSSYWANFVKTGDPNAQGLPVWEPYSGNKQVMRLGEDMGMILVTASEERFEFLKKQLLGDQ